MSHLLIVEDDAAIAEALHLALTSLGHVVHTAETAERGLAVLAGSEPLDLAVVDVMLPGMDGFEFCRRVSANEALPLVLLTARSDPIDVVVGLECGADDYVVKPVEPRVLDARIKDGRRAGSGPSRDARETDTVGGLSVMSAAAVRISRGSIWPRPPARTGDRTGHERQE